MDAIDFQRSWIDASRQKERSAYVTHFNDLCDRPGVNRIFDENGHPVATAGAQQ